ncbi:MAG: nucleotidyltransferase domain-containing protein [Firmicutes bacterium]|nr:nucleotidyltransferase domain-containing protein [[Eubacterium] siraeum]MCM1487841.1 nucleotidyltransferase domain-containing protein [Bacillota bacterium]
MNDTEIKSTISEKLAEIEAAENVKILHCVESGSRAWGFASSDSDYDVRFIYVRKPEFYLKLEKTSDVIEWQLDNVFDINGWDIQKAFRLLHKSNMTLFEWDRSPIVYKTSDEWLLIREIMDKYFIVKMGLYHYLNMAERNFGEYLTADEVKLKKYFYALRPILACRWIKDKETPPPVLFSELVKSELDADMLPIVNDLIDTKIHTPEIGVGKRIDALNSYIEKNIAEIRAGIESCKTKINHWEELDRLFCRLVGI